MQGSKELKKSVLIVGASGTIGSSIASVLFKNKFSLILLGKENNDRLNKLSIKFKCPKFNCDLTNIKEVEKTFQSIKKTTDSLDCIIYSVAKPFPNKLLHNTDITIIEEQINIQLIAFHRLMVQSLPFLDKSVQDGSIPRIILISSEFVLGTPPIKIGPYIAAKSAVTSYAKVLAQEWIKKGIRVFILAPGMVRSRLTQDLPEEYLKNIEKQLPEKTLTRPSDIADYVEAILTSKLDSSYGITLQVSKAHRR